jgi:hypothetical protein
MALKGLVIQNMFLNMQYISILILASKDDIVVRMTLYECAFDMKEEIQNNSISYLRKRYS